MSKEALKARYEARTLKVERVPLPASEGDWHVRELSAPEDIAFNKGWDDHEKNGQQIAWFVVCAACDADGKRLFDDGDLAWLVEKVPGWVLKQVWRIGGKMNGLTKEATEELEKNSGTTPSGASS